MEPWRRGTIVVTLSVAALCCFLAPRRLGGNRILNLFMSPVESTSVAMAATLVMPLLLAVAFFVYSTRPKP